MINSYSIQVSINSIFKLNQYLDKKNNEFWYINKDISENQEQFKLLKQSFKLCKSLNNDLKQGQKDNINKYTRVYIKENLPKFITRIEKKETKSEKIFEKVIDSKSLKQEKGKFNFFY